MHGLYELVEYTTYIHEREDCLKANRLAIFAGVPRVIPNW